MGARVLDRFESEGEAGHAQDEPERVWIIDANRSIPAIRAELKEHLQAYVDQFREQQHPPRRSKGGCARPDAGLSIFFDTETSVSENIDIAHAHAMSENVLIEQNKAAIAAMQRELGARLRAARIQRQMTQADVANAAGVSRPTVIAMEAGQSTSLQNILAIMLALNLSLATQSRPTAQHRPRLKDLMQAERERHAQVRAFSPPPPKPPYPSSTMGRRSDPLPPIYRGEGRVANPPPPPQGHSVAQPQRPSLKGLMADERSRAGDRLRMRG